MLDTRRRNRLADEPAPLAEDEREGVGEGGTRMEELPVLESRAGDPPPVWLGVLDDALACLSLPGDLGNAEWAFSLPDPRLRLLAVIGELAGTVLLLVEGGLAGPREAVPMEVLGVLALSGPKSLSASVEPGNPLTEEVGDWVRCSAGCCSGENAGWFEKSNGGGWGLVVLGRLAVEDFLLSLPIIFFQPLRLGLVLLLWVSSHPLLD